MEVNIKIDTDNPPSPQDFKNLGMWALSVSELPGAAVAVWTAEELAESAALSAQVPKAPIPDATDAAFAAAPTPPAPVAPLAPPPPPPAPPAAPAALAASEYDSQGVPWDERIHSGSKGQKNDGTWNRRKNVPDATYNAVLASLPRRAVTAAPVAPVAPPVTPPVAHATPAPLPTSDAAGIAAINAAVMGGKLDFATVAAACAMVGATNLLEAQRTPGNVTEIHAFLQAQNPAAFA